METVNIYKNDFDLLEKINQQYGINGDNIYLHRTSGGRNTVYHKGQFTWMDFDRTSMSHPVIDVGWLTDGSDFNNFDENALERSRRLFDKLYKGYSIERSLTQSEISAVFHCTAIIHYDLLSSITIKNGDSISPALFDEQHNWLMRWRDLCNKM